MQYLVLQALDDITAAQFIITTANNLAVTAFVSTGLYHFIVRVRDSPLRARLTFSRSVCYVALLLARQ